MEVLQFVGYRMAQSGGTSVVLVTTDLVTLLNTGIVTIIILRSFLYVFVLLSYQYILCLLHYNVIRTYVVSLCRDCVTTELCYKA